MRRPDPRGPLVVDTHELGRRPGAMLTVVREVPAPSRFGVDVVGVPAQSLLDLDLRLESVVEGVLVSGTVRGRAVGECSRCLDAVDQPLEVSIQQLYDYPDQHHDRRYGVGHRGEPTVDGPEETCQVKDDLIDLEPVLRDLIVLGLPLKPLCRDDCPGLCPQCGTRLADDPEHEHPVLDPRWAALLEVSDPHNVSADALTDSLMHASQEGS